MSSKINIKYNKSVRERDCDSGNKIENTPFNFHLLYQLPTG